MLPLTPAKKRETRWSLRRDKRWCGFSNQIHKCLHNSKMSENQMDYFLAFDWERRNIWILLYFQYNMYTKSKN